MSGKCVPFMTATWAALPKNIRRRAKVTFWTGNFHFTDLRLTGRTSTAAISSPKGKSPFGWNARKRNSICRLAESTNGHMETVLIPLPHFPTQNPPASTCQAWIFGLLLSIPSFARADGWLRMRYTTCTVQGKGLLRKTFQPSMALR
jgi:hypothetical protein